MKKTYTTLLFLLVTVTIFAQNYTQDILDDNFSCQTITLKNDYEGKNVATLIKYSDTLRQSTHKAVLYIHGFNDYFFQTELAEKVSNMGYNFYALDLRKYGRSYMAHQRQFNVRKIEEYYEDIDSAVNIIKHELNDSIYLMGHSTGGLTTTLYVYEHDKGVNIKGLILNSPFYEQNQSWFNKHIGIPIVSLLSYIMPNAKFNQAYSTSYTESLHKSYGKEWDYDLNLKKVSSPAVTFSWLRTIYKAQNKIAKIKDMPIPVIVMHSDKSTFDNDYNENFNNSDVVLNIDDIKKHAAHMGSNVRTEVIKGGIHDLALSKKEVRESFYEKIKKFLLLTVEKY